MDLGLFQFQLVSEVAASLLIFLLFCQVVGIVDVADDVLLVQRFAVLEDGWRGNTHLEDLLKLLLLLACCHCYYYRGDRVVIIVNRNRRDSV